MRLVDEPEVALEPVDDRGVGAEQRAVAAQQVLERGLPPRELELVADAVLGHVPHRQLGQQRLEAERGELGAQRRALDEVVEDVGLGGERRRACGRAARPAASTSRSAPVRPRIASSSARSASTRCQATCTSARPSGTSGVTPAST